jgi:hypothetical protein
MQKVGWEGIQTPLSPHNQHLTGEAWWDTRYSDYIFIDMKYSDYKKL